MQPGHRRKPFRAPVGTGPNTVGKGLTASIGVSVTTQPHTATGEYKFTLDQPWQALLGAFVTLKDSASATLDPFVDANVRANNSGARMGVDPGTDTTIANQTVRIRFRNSGGTLADPPANGGFWVTLVLKRTAVV